MLKAKDKQLHFIAGFLIALLFATLISWQVGLIICAVIGIGKEVYDHVSGKGTPELLDFVATILGGGLAVIAIQIITILRS